IGLTLSGDPFCSRRAAPKMRLITGVFDFIQCFFQAEMGRGCDPRVCGWGAFARAAPPCARLSGMKAIALFGLLLLGACEQKSAPAAATVTAAAAAAAAAPAGAAPSAAAPAAAAPTAAAAPAPGDPPAIPVGTKLKCPVTGEDFVVRDK